MVVGEDFSIRAEQALKVACSDVSRCKLSSCKLLSRMECEYARKEELGAHSYENPAAQAPGFQSSWDWQAGDSVLGKPAAGQDSSSGAHRESKA